MTIYKKLKIIIPILLFVLFGLLSLRGLPMLDDLLYDNVLAGERKPDENIVIVGLDKRSVDEIGTWPWPRFYIADAIEKLVDMDAAAIGASILYDTYGADDAYDEALVAAAAKTDRLVLAAYGIFNEDFQEALNAVDFALPFDELNEVSASGFINTMPDEGGVLRRALTKFSYGDTTVYSLPLEVYRTYCRVMGIKENDVPLDSFGQFPIDYVGKPQTFTMLSLWGVINDEYNSDIFKDAIVLIGPYAEGIGTGNYATPLERRTQTYGVEINANIIQNMLEGRFKQDAPWWLNISIMAALALLAAVLLYKAKKPMAGALVTVALIAAQLICAKLVYTQADLILKAGSCVVYLFLFFITDLMLNILSVQHEKQHIQGLFGRFVAPEVVNEMISRNVNVQLGGMEKEITVLFVDIRGFTAFSEVNPPEKVVSMVNRYLSLTSAAIQNNAGTIDKYIGDATMAVFNTPNELANHALCAVKAAWEMKAGSNSLRQEILNEYGVDLQFGIGVNTGPAVVGNMGSDFRMDYTAIGDTVNTAARLESNAQKGQILISDATYQLVKDYVEVTDLGVINVKNKKVGIQIYNLDSIHEFSPV